MVYAHSTFTGTFNLAQTVDIQIPTTNPAMSIDTPGNWAQVGATFTIAGWAIDRNAPSGVGVDVLHIYAYLNGTGTPVFLGAASTGGARPDIGAYFGSQFTNSGWGLTATGLSPGNYLLVVYPHDTITGNFTGASTVWVTVGGEVSASPGPSGGVGPQTADARPLLPARPAWPWWLVAVLVGLTLTGLRVFLGHGRTVGGRMRIQQTWTVLILAGLLGATGVRAQEVAPAPPLRAVHELLALSYPELRASGLEARAVTTPEGVVVTFAARGPVDPAVAAQTAPSPAELTALVTVDGTGRVRHLACRGPWTGLGQVRAVIGRTRSGVEARLTAAKARFGGAREEDVKTEARRLLDRHGLKGVRIDSAILQEAQGTVLWVTRGATEGGESLAVHLEPLTGKLIAFHVGGER